MTKKILELVKLTWNSQSIHGWVTHSDNSNPIVSNLKINLNRCHEIQIKMNASCLNQRWIIWNLIEMGSRG